MGKACPAEGCFILWTECILGAKKQSVEKGGVVSGVKAVNGFTHLFSKKGRVILRRNLLGRNDCHRPIGFGEKIDPLGAKRHGFSSANLRGATEISDRLNFVPGPQRSKAFAEIKPHGDTLLCRGFSATDGNGNTVVCFRRPAGDFRLQPNRFPFQSLRRKVTPGGVCGEVEKAQSQSKKNPRARGRDRAFSKQKKGTQ